MNERDGPAPGVLARRLIRQAERASLATAGAPDGRPYVSLVLVAADYDASPLMLLSALAEHTRNLQRDPRVALLFDGTGGLAEPLTGPRLTLQGRIAASDDPRHRRRFLARHPDATQYADFGDFAVYRLDLERGHLVAGFGRIDWLPAAQILAPEPGAACADWEQAVVEHMNQDHSDAVDLCATRLLGAAGGGWRITGCDGEGCDLRRGGAVLRLDFSAVARSAADARRELIALVSQARATAGGGPTNR